MSDSFTVISTPSQAGLFPIEIQELILIGTVDLTVGIISKHHCIVNGSGIFHSGDTGYIALFWNNIITGASILPGSFYQYLINNTFIGGSMNIYNHWKTIIRGNTLTGGGATIISLQNIYFQQIQTYSSLVACENANSNTAGICGLCSYATNPYMKVSDCTIFQLNCLGSNLQYCPFIASAGIYNVNCPGPYVLRFEYNNYSYAGYGDVEYGTMQMIGGVQFLNNYAFNPLPGGPVSYSPCKASVGAFGITYGNVASCVYINSNETIMGNILENCTDGGIYAGHNQRHTYIYTQIGTPV